MSEAAFPSVSYLHVKYSDQHHARLRENSLKVSRHLIDENILFFMLKISADSYGISLNVLVV